MMHALAIIVMDTCLSIKHLADHSNQHVLGALLAVGDSQGDSAILKGDQCPPLWEL